MPCEVCESIILEIIMNEDDISLDVDFEGEFVSGATGEEYQNGYDKGYIEGEKASYQNGYEAGLSVLPPDMEWAKYTETVTIRDLNVFGKETVELTFPNVKTQNLTLTVHNDTVKHLIINHGIPLTTLDRGFYWGLSSGVLEHLTINADTSQCVSLRQLVNYAYHLTTIDGTPLDFSSSTNNAGVLIGCIALTYIRVAPASIKVSASFSGAPKLDNESIQSIIDGLADLTGSTAQTVTVHADIKARIEANPVWLATITGKNWTLA